MLELLSGSYEFPRAQSALTQLTKQSNNTKRKVKITSKDSRHDKSQEQYTQLGVGRGSMKITGFDSHLRKIEEYSI